MNGLIAQSKEFNDTLIHKVPPTAT